MNTYKGFFTPVNSDKYKGDPSQIVYRSSWELTFMSYVDKHPDIKKWASEEIIIPYISPLDQRIHRYYPDFWIEKNNSEIWLIEIKPKKQCSPPIIKESKRKNSRYLKETMTFMINQAKWKATREFCNKKNWKFYVMTEEDLYGSNHI